MWDLLGSGFARIKQLYGEDIVSQLSQAASVEILNQSVGDVPPVQVIALQIMYIFSSVY